MLPFMRVFVRFANKGLGMEIDEKIRATSGMGNWSGFLQSGVTVENVLEAAKGWEKAILGVDKPWLCWNINPDWAIVQQRLVESVGWVPVVGYDPRVGPPPLTKNAILVDFNKGLDFPVMYPHFPLEFAFAFAPRLAFWHSDLLLRVEKMAQYSEMFELLQDGELSATQESTGLFQRLDKQKLRYWELLGCVTRGASKSNFENGCGWWLNFSKHPSCTDIDEQAIRSKYHWECGVGIRYWAKKYKQKVKIIPEDNINEGHFTRINNQSYVSSSPNDWRRDVSKDLVNNFELLAACRSLKLEHLL